MKTRVNLGRSARATTARSAKPAASPSEDPRFRRIFYWVVLGHAAALVALGFFTCSRPKPPTPEILQLLPEGQLVRGEPGGGATSGSKPPPPPSPAVPTPPTPSEVAPPPSPAPEMPKPIPTPPVPAPVSKPKPQPAPKPVPPKPKEEIAVNLKEVTRAKPEPKVPPKKAEPPAKPSATPAPPATESTDFSANPNAVRERLAGRLGQAGVRSATADGTSGVPGGTAQGGENALYYTRIRDIFYEAWRQPVNIGQKKLSTILKIRVGKNGSVMQWSVAQSSGEPAMDASVEAAARQVPSVGAPLPATLGMEFADITIAFEL